MKLGTIGCSHSSDFLGDSWPVFLAQKINYELCQYFSSGGGNEGANVEKLLHMLENDNPNLIVVGITEISRFVVSVGNSPNANSRETFNDETYYTFNTRGNHNYLKNHGIKWNCDESIWKMMASKYNSEFKIFHTLQIYEHLSHLYKTPIYYFTWFNDIYALLEKYPMWSKIFPTDRFLFNCAQNYMSRYYSEYMAECGHFHPMAHYHLADVLLSRLKEQTNMF